MPAAWEEASREEERQAERGVCVCVCVCVASSTCFAILPLSPANNHSAVTLSRPD